MTLPHLRADPPGDYGDAPDDGPSYYPDMFSTSSSTAKFPTEFGTHFSRTGQPGAYHINTGEEWLGKQPDSVSVEQGASDPADPDGQPNLINSDHWDGGFPKIPFFMVLTSIPPASSISFFVSKSVASDYYGYLYVNVLIDWNQDGKWEDLPAELTEWVVRNQTVNINPGQTSLETSTPFAWGWNALLAPQLFWVRMTLTRFPIGLAQYAGYVDANGCWDGSGMFDYGETEDFLFHPDSPLVQNKEGPWNPPGVDGGGGGDTNTNTNVWAIAKARPKDQGISHTQVAYVDIVTIPPDFVDPAGKTPFVKRWWVDPCGGYGRSSDLSPTAVHTMPGSGTGVTTFDPGLPGGPPGTIATVVVIPLTHDYSLTEHIPVVVRVKWPGVFLLNCEATVHVRHSNNMNGAFGSDSCYNHIERRISATTDLPYPTKDSMYGLLDDSMENFAIGNFSGARVSMMNLQTEIDNNQAVFEAEVRNTPELPGLPGRIVNNYEDLTQAICGITDGLDALIATNLPPVRFETTKPGDWTYYPPSPGHIAGNDRQLRATCRYPGTTHISFQWWDENAGGESGDWVTLGTETVTAEGLAVHTLNTAGIPEGKQWFRVYPLGGPGYPIFSPDEAFDNMVATIDNTVPDPGLGLDIVCPADISACAVVEVSGIPETFSGEGYALAEVKSVESIEDEWMVLGIGGYFGDEDIPDDDGKPARIPIDASSLSNGTYTVRCRLVDLAGNSTVYANTETVTVHPSYAAWKMMYGKFNELAETNDDEDELTLIEEYYLGYNPTEADAWDHVLLSIARNPDGGDTLLLSTPRRQFLSGVESTVFRSDQPGGEFMFWKAFDSKYPQDLNLDLEVNPLDFAPYTSQFFKQHLEER